MILAVDTHHLLLEYAGTKRVTLNLIAQLQKMPDVERPYKAFGYPVIPALYIVLTTLICIDLLVYKTFNCGMGLLIIALGVPVYFMFKRSKNAVQEN